MIRVLYVGQMWTGGTCLARANVLRARGWEVIPFDVSGYLSAGSRVSRSLQHRLLIGPDIYRLNTDLLASIKDSTKPDVVWVDKGRSIFSSTIDEIKRYTGAYLVHYTPDPAFTVHISRHFRRAISTYDLCITTKRYELQQYEEAGAKETLFTYQGVDDRFWKIKECGDISGSGRRGSIFIGHYEPHYEDMLDKLARKKVPLTIWGDGWNRKVQGRSPLTDCIRGEGIWGDTYAQKISGAEIGIGLLSKMCPDQFTTRTFEIPAAGTMLLAERTPEHLELFQEGKEADYFSSHDELCEKASFYLRNGKARTSIAKSGRLRCLSSYRWSEVLQYAFKAVEKSL